MSCSFFISVILCGRVSIASSHIPLLYAFGGDIKVIPCAVEYEEVTFEPVSAFPLTDFERLVLFVPDLFQIQDIVLVGVVYGKGPYPLFRLPFIEIVVEIPGAAFRCSVQLCEAGDETVAIFLCHLICASADGNNTPLECRGEIGRIEALPSHVQQLVGRVARLVGIGNPQRLLFVIPAGCLLIQVSAQGATESDTSRYPTRC